MGKFERATAGTPSPLVQPASNDRNSTFDQVHSGVCCA